MSSVGAEAGVEIGLFPVRQPLTGDVNVQRTRHLESQGAPWTIFSSLQLISKSDFGKIPKLYVLLRRLSSDVVREWPRPLEAGGFKWESILPFGLN